jgi:hypothetical protein
MMNAVANGMSFSPCFEFALWAEKQFVLRRTMWFGRASAPHEIVFHNCDG